MATDLSASSPVTLDIADGVAEVTLNRPERLNAFNEDMHEAMRAALDAAETPGAARALLLTGAGRGFCAGQDLSDRAVQPGAERRDLADTLRRNYNPLIKRLRAFPGPVVVAVNGVAAGAGANLALAGDIVIAGASAKFIQAFSKLGLIPDAGGSFALPRRVGLARAMGLALTAEPLSAEDAAAWGLIWRAVGDDELMARARELARGFAAGPTRGYVATRRAFDAALGNDLEAQLALEADLQSQAGFSDDYAEGVAAFLEKRAPNFTGR